MRTPRSQTVPRIEEGVEDLSDDEACTLFDRQARKFLGISGEEFLRRYDAGEFRECGSLNVSRLLILMPLVRRESNRAAD